jgi:DinB family protein
VRRLKESPDATWRRLQEEHTRAVEQFVALAAAVMPERWSTEPAAQKWSPAQVTEHVVLAYEAVLAELAGGPPMRFRTKRWQRAVLRLTVLPRILKTGRLPHGVRAPREIRPGPSAASQAELLEKLWDRARRADAELTSRQTAHLTHPYLGRLRAEQALRFCAIHTTHHASQLNQNQTARPAV